MSKADHRPSLPRKGGEFHFNPRGPNCTLRDAANALGITYEQARYLELQAFTKLRAALSAFGYHKEPT